MQTHGAQFQFVIREQQFAVGIEVLRNQCIRSIGQFKLTVTLPDESVINNLATSLSKLLATQAGALP